MITFDEQQKLTALFLPNPPRGVCDILPIMALLAIIITMDDFEIEDFDASNSYDNFASKWGSEKSSKGVFFGGSAGDDDNQYDFEFVPEKKGPIKVQQSSPDSSKAKSKQPDVVTKSTSAIVSTDSALDRANSMLAKYSTTTTKKPATLSKKVPKDFDEDDISLGSEDDDDEFEVSASPGDKINSKKYAAKSKPKVSRSMGGKGESCTISQTSEISLCFD